MGDWMDGLDAPDARRFEYEDEGDQLVGEILALGTYSGDYGTSRTVTVMPDVEHTLESGQRVQAGEALIIYCSPKILADEIEAKDPRVGDQIAIRYLGEKNAKKGDNTYKVFRVALKRGNAAAAALDQDAEKADW